MTLRPFGPLAILLAAATACGEREPVQNRTVRDSAGVRIVENRAPEWTEGVGITVAAEPRAVVGSATGPVEQQLDRVTDATVLPDGGLALLNSGPGQMQIHSPDGAHRITVGREGGGPGEFRTPRWLVVRADTLAVFDPFQSNGRLSLFTLDGELVATRRVLVEGLDFPSPDLMLPDGSYLDQVSEGSVGFQEVGHVVYTRKVIRYPRNGSPVDTLLEAPGGEAFRVAVGDGIAQFPVPFGRESFTAIGPDRIYVGDGSALVIDVYDLTGAHVLSIRADVEPRPVSEAERERWIDATLSAAVYETRPAAAERARGAYLETPIPDRMPAHAALVADGRGNLWVRRYAPPWEEANEWWVFGAGGSWLGTVQLPLGLEVFEIGTAHVLGLRRDALDVEHVELYGLSGPS